MAVLLAALLVSMSGDEPRAVGAEELRHIVDEIGRASGSLDEVRRFQIALPLGALQTRCGDHEAAEATFEVVVEFLFPDGRPRSSLYAGTTERLIAAQIRAGELDGARATCERAERAARTVKDPDKRADALHAVALNWAVAGDLRRGHTLMDESTEHFLKKPPRDASAGPLHLMVVRAQVTRMMDCQLGYHELRHALLRGDRARAAAIRDTLETEFKATILPELRRELLRDLSGECLSGEDVDGALRIARQMDDGAGRVKAGSLVRAASSLLNRGDRDEALAVVLQARPLLGPTPFRGPDPERNHLAKGPDRLTQLPRSLAWLLAELGERDEAIEVAEGMGDRPLRVASLADIALADARRGDLEDAELLFRRAESESDPLRLNPGGIPGCNALAWVARARLEAGLLVGDPLTLAPLAPTTKDGPLLRGFWLSGVAQGYAELGDLDTAFRLAGSVESRFLASMTFKEVASTFVMRGDPGLLLDRVLEIKDAEIRGAMLEGLAEGLELRTR